MRSFLISLIIPVFLTQGFIQIFKKTNFKSIIFLSDSEAPVMQSRVEVFSRVGCKFCRIAKAKLEELGVPFITFDINEEYDDLDSPLPERLNLSRTTTVPQIYIGSDHIGGCSDLLKKIEENTFNSLLEKYNIIPNVEKAANEETETEIFEPVGAPVAGEPMNSKRYAIISEDLPLAELSMKLQEQALTLTDRYVSKDGKTINYNKIKTSKDLRIFIGLSSQLLDCNLNELKSWSDSQKFVFFSNLYNAMIIHANCVIPRKNEVDLPLPEAIAARGDFFSGHTGAIYNIGGLIFSPDDIEHGILRANKGHPSTPERKGYFPDGDSRAELSIGLESFDPRVHFILNCGAASCPPISILKLGNLEDAMRGAAAAYLLTEVRVNESSKKIFLPKLLLWYGHDFSDDQLGLVRKVIELLPDSVIKEKLMKVMNSNFDDYSIEFNLYDWTLNTN